ncbi:MAG: bifunctional phosphopantothenoylcysteine decarboxylase/phosphopantothenate--cysteine ligase CoaBC [Chloroflexi bacterium]|nr:bifunctional phosphopantothenoylcysteine decarboxylase/phosphopantothenate--cysteine ligase CoaBC [Chloroflexota bacterium]
MPLVALTGARVVVGVSGGIACYKAVELVRQLMTAGAVVDVIMTAAAQRFVQPLTFQSLTHRKVATDVWEPWSGEEHGHVSLGEQADLLIVAPATANTIARLAAGLSDDMLTITALATEAPLLIAPAMDRLMYTHVATQANLATLAARGATIVGPDEGRLASGAIGPGRLVAVGRIVAAAAGLLAGRGTLRGRHIVITSGGTQEPLDPVRFIGNRSSGKMGAALAAAALARGARVTYIVGPGAAAAPPAVTTVPVTTALAMQVAVEAATRVADALIMAAAVADYRPAIAAEQKIKKGEGGLTVELVKNPDILASLDRPGLIKIGFAAETNDLLTNARAKLAAKGLALIVANDAVSSIGADDSAVTLLDAEGGVEALSVQPKAATAGIILDRLAALLAARD